MASHSVEEMGDLVMYRKNRQIATRSFELEHVDAYKNTAYMISDSKRMTVFYIFLVLYFCLLYF